MKVLGLSDTGYHRKKNEDRFIIKESGNAILLAVMDGMGGLPGGERASELVQTFLAALELSPETKVGQLLELIDKINDEISRIEAEHPELYGMGSTLTAAVVHNNSVQYVHVGDSRLYLGHSGRLKQITKDHNMAQFLYEEGELTEEELLTSPMRNLLDQCLGGSFMAADSGVFAIEPGDRLLLCSDGIHDELPPDEIASLMCGGSIEDLPKALIDAALAAGGRDNISAVVLEY